MGHYPLRPHYLRECVLHTGIIHFFQLFFVVFETLLLPHLPPTYLSPADILEARRKMIEALHDKNRKTQDKIDQLNEKYVSPLLSTTTTTTTTLLFYFSHIHFTLSSPPPQIPPLQGSACGSRDPACVVPERLPQDACTQTQAGLRG